LGSPLVARLLGAVDPSGSGRGARKEGFLGEEDEAEIRAPYPGPTWDRLRELKRRYDLENLFRLNHDIPPAEG
jgi:hypothetical protein